MVLGEDVLQRLLDRALERVCPPEGFGAALEGSIAQGFGNETSDVDFVLIDPRDRRHPTMPTVLFIDRRRVEVRVRSALEMRREAEPLLRGSGRSRSAWLRLDEEGLDRCQRFAHSLPLRNRALVDAVRREIPADRLGEAIDAWFREGARESARCSVALRSLGREDGAVGWARSALTLAAKSWLARRGETYLAKKWIMEQLDRVPDGGEMRRRVRELESPARAGLGAGAYVRSVVGFLHDVGIDGCDADAANVELIRKRNVTTWPIGSRIHLVRDRRDVFMLSESAGRLWRSLRFRRPIPELLDRLSPHDAALLSELHRLGLIGIGWRGAGEIRARRVTTLAPAMGRPLLSVRGGEAGAEAPIRLLPLDARRFSEAGLSMVYVNMVIENAREDAVGAMAARQWGVFERAVRRMLRHLSMAALDAHGVHPLPPVEEVHLSLRELEDLPETLRDGVAKLDAELRVDGSADAAHVLREVDGRVAEMRESTGTRFPSSFASPRKWQETLDMGYDWVRLVAYLGAGFPIDMVRDLIATGGQQPHGLSASASERAGSGEAPHPQ